MVVIKSKIACLGIIRGYVIKIKNPHLFLDFDFSQKPYILVCHHTNPDFMPIIYQVKGIIGAVGGVCSHFGIVSRELNIPCLAGPKNIFEILKDNQRVELNAVKGIIKIF